LATRISMLRPAILIRQFLLSYNRSWLVFLQE
jgi:hypothetical protein